MTKKKRPGLTPELDLILDSVCVPVETAGPIFGVTIQVARAQLRALQSVVRAARRECGCKPGDNCRMQRALATVLGLSGQQGGRR